MRESEVALHHAASRRSARRMSSRRALRCILLGAWLGACSGETPLPDAGGLADADTALRLALGPTVSADVPTRIVTLHVAMGHGRGVAALTRWADASGGWDNQVAQLIELDAEGRPVAGPTQLVVPFEEPGFGLRRHFVLEVVETDEGFLVFVGLRAAADFSVGDEPPATFDVILALELGPDLAQVGATEVSRDYYQPFPASFVRVGDAILGGWSGGGPRLYWLDLHGRPTTEVPLPAYGCVSALAAGPEVAVALVHTGATMADQRTSVLWIDPSGAPPLVTPAPPMARRFDGVLEDSSLICTDQHVVLARLRDGGFLVDAFGGAWRADMSNVTPIPRDAQSRAFSQLGRGVATTRATVSAVLIDEETRGGGSPLQLAVQRWTATGAVEDTAWISTVGEIEWPLGAAFDLTPIDDARLLVAYANTSSPGPHLRIVTLE